MSVLRAAFEPRRGPERRDFSSGWLDVVFRRSKGKGLDLTGDSAALQLLTVWACVNLKVDTFTGLPVAAFRGSGAEKVRVDPDPPLLITPTGATVPWDEFIGMSIVSHELRGNIFGQVLEYDRRTTFPRSIQLHHPDEVRTWFDRDEGVPLYRVPGMDGPQRRYPVGDIWHVKGLTLPGLRRSVRGLNPIEHAALTIGTALAAEEFGSNYFDEAAQPAGVLSTDQDLEEPEAKDIQQRWVASHGDRRRAPAVLPKGTHWESISIKPEEAQFLQTIAAKRTDVCGFFRVPPHMIGIVEKSTSWGTGIEEQTLGFITYTIGGPLVRLERALSALLPPEQYVKFNLAGLLRGRLIDRYRAYLMGRQGGWLSIDDIRALEELPSIGPGGGDYSQPMNWGTVPIDPTKDPEPVREEQAAAMLGAIRDVLALGDGEAVT